MEIHEAGGGGRHRIGGGAAGQTERQCILGAGQEPARAGCCLRLVLDQPAELEGGHQRLGRIAEDRAGADRRERGAKGRERLGAARVGVENRVVDGLARAIDRNQVLHRAGQHDRIDPVRPDLR